MKRILSILVLIVAASPLFAQQPPDTVPPLDTIVGKSLRYHYTDWYDTCPNFVNFPDTTDYLFGINNATLFLNTTNSFNVCSQYTERPLPVKGIAAMVAIRPQDVGLNMYPNNYPNAVRAEEHMRLYQYTEIGDTNMILLEDVRWDTVTPKVMKLPRKLNAVDSADFSYCYVYECLFKSPVYVDSTFYIGGTFNSNIHSSEPPYLYAYAPTVYVGMMNFPWVDSRCRSSMTDMDLTHGIWEHPYSVAYQYFGVFLPIVDNHRLEVYSDSLDLGEVSGSGEFYDQSFDTIRAIPRPGCKFTHWNDGSTENPRVVFLTQDTVFTAFFAEISYYHLALSSNNPEWGSVDGDGYYPEQQPVTITAIPTDSYCSFEQWDDGDWHNPREVYLSSDTSFTAIFSHYEDSSATAIAHVVSLSFNLSPNPVRNLLTLTVDMEGDYIAEIYDLTGRRFLRHSFSGSRTRLSTADLPAGAYLLKLRGDKGSCVRRFVKR